MMSLFPEGHCEPLPGTAALALLGSESPPCALQPPPTTKRRQAGTESPLTPVVQHPRAKPLTHPLGPPPTFQGRQVLPGDLELLAFQLRRGQHRQQGTHCGVKDQRGLSPPGGPKAAPLQPQLQRGRAATRLGGRAGLSAQGWAPTGTPPAGSPWALKAPCSSRKVCEGARSCRMLR